MTAEEIVVPPVQKVVIIEQRDALSAGNLATVKTVETDANQLTAENLVDFEAASITAQGNFWEFCKKAQDILYNLSNVTIIFFFFFKTSSCVLFLQPDSLVKIERT